MEIWRKVEGWPYSVSSMGRVVSDRTGRVLSQGKDKDGYFRVTLCYKRERYSVRVHRLMMLTFCPEGKLDQVDHINQDHQDNRLDNLRWATSKINMNNRGCSKTVSVDGRAITLMDAWANSKIVNYHTFRDRVLKGGWSVDEARKTPARKYSKRLSV